MSVNISANSISFANDITTLALKYFNIRRGVLFAAVIGGWAMCPWIIIASAKSLLSFLSAYAIFMAPMTGILFTEYWLVKHRKYDVVQLYDPRGIYGYWNGINWRALLVTLVVIVPLLPGMAKKVASDSVDIDVGLRHLFDFNWLYGFVLSIAMYWPLDYFFPARTMLIPEVVHGTPAVIEGVDADSEKQVDYPGDVKPSFEVKATKDMSA